MVELTHTAVKAIFAPPLVPMDRAIDVEHLARMTLGDQALEREVLGLFVRQIELLRPRIEASEPEVSGAAAHTLRGSAAGIGAWAVARAAAEVEAFSKARDSRLSSAMQDLDSAIELARADISETLRAGSN
ncbi:MAG: Hpt domain-containing protein [Hyphomicrobium sp.]